MARVNQLLAIGGIVGLLVLFACPASAECYKKDNYDRDVCKVWVKPTDCPNCGKFLDLGLARIREAMAWWDRNHADEQSEEDRGALPGGCSER